MDMVCPPSKAMPGQANPLRRYELRGVGIRTLGSGNSAEPIPTRKASLVMGKGCPYRKPPLVDWDKRPKALERTSVKELGKRAP